MSILQGIAALVQTAGAKINSTCHGTTMDGKTPLHVASRL